MKDIPFTSAIIGLIVFVAGIAIYVIGADKEFSQRIMFSGILWALISSIVMIIQSFTNKEDA